MVGEQLTPELFDEGFKMIVEARPQVIVSHDAPISILKQMCPNLMPSFSRTALFLDDVYCAFKPQHWFFGHHHVTRTMQTYQTQFMCLAELDMETLEING